MFDYIKDTILENKILIIIFIIFIIIRSLIFPFYSIEGASMDYTLEHGEKVIGTNYFEIDRFDIVIMDVPELDKYYIKRIIGIPGDRIEYKNDELYINNELVTEPYLETKKEEWLQFTEDLIIEKVPDDEYFVLGDNRRNSKDSRDMGTIPKENILSEALLIYWPLNKVNLIKWLNKPCNTLNLHRKVY